MTPSSLPWRASCALRTILPFSVCVVCAIVPISLLLGGVIAGAEAILHLRDHGVDHGRIGLIRGKITTSPQNLKPLGISKAAIAQHVGRHAVDACRIVPDVFEQFLF